MKKIVLTILCLSLHYVLMACGCDMLITYQGIMPSDYNGMIGLNMRQRYFKGAAMSHIHANGKEHLHGQMNQVLTNYEINYRLFITKRLLLSGTIPIADYKLSSSKAAAPVRKIGMSDPILLLKYELISPSQNKENKIKQRLLFGIGVKLPLGAHYSVFVNNLPQDENLLQLQLGTGSIDYIANASYQLRKNNFGLQSDISFKLNSSNKYGYRKGNQWNFQTNGFYQKRLVNSVLMLYVGTALENTNDDKILNTNLNNSGGTNLFASLGFDFYIKKTTLFFNYQHLVKQELNGFQMKNNLKFTLGINYNFTFRNQ